MSKPDNLPIVLMIAGFGILLAWWWRTARRNDRILESGGEEALARAMDGPPPPEGEDLPGGKVHTWPHLLRIELLGAMVVLIFLGVWSILVDAPLEQMADPSRTPNPSKAPWYFLGLQEMLVYFDPWIAGVTLPGLIIFGLCAIPYLDPNPSASGYYAWRPRRLAISIFLFGFVGLWLPLIVIGTFFRGPGWAWFWPWQPWTDAHAADAPMRNLPALLGVTSSSGEVIVGAAVLLLYFGVPLIWAHTGKRRTHPWYERLGAGRVSTLVLLAAAMLGLPIKMALRLLLDVKYVLASPWFNV